MAACMLVSICAMRILADLLAMMATSEYGLRLRPKLLSLCNSMCLSYHSGGSRGWDLWLYIHICKYAPLP